MRGRGVVIDPASLGHRGTSYVLIYICLAAACYVCWLVVRVRANRGGRTATRIFSKLNPQAQALRSWALMAPATLVYCGAWTATTILVQGSPKALIQTFTVVNSSNIDGLLFDPFRALAASALLVADRGFGFLAYVAVYALIVARLEQRLGTARTLLVWLVAHFGGSLLTVGIQLLGVHQGVSTAELATTADVGVSYVMVGSMAAYALLVGTRWRYYYWAGLGIGLTAPLALSGSIWDIGHIIAALLGLLAGFIALKVAPARPQLRWRDLSKAPLELVQVSRGIPRIDPASE